MNGSDLGISYGFGRVNDRHLDITSGFWGWVTEAEVKDISPPEDSTPHNVLARERLYFLSAEYLQFSLCPFRLASKG